MKVAIIGLGYVGMTALSCLTKEGHTVVGVDKNADKVNLVNAGFSPIAEPGVPELVADAVRRGRLKAVTELDRELDSCEIAIVCVGTPSAPSGEQNLGFIIDATREIAEAIDQRRERPITVVYRSTIRPGTIQEKILPIFDAALGDKSDCVNVVYNPEFLRESVAIKDYFNPPRIVIGTRDGNPCGALDELNKNINAEVFYTRYREAEFTKFVDNTFHALKAAFANEVGRVAHGLGLEQGIVHQIFVADRKLNISPVYLRPGCAFGGSCLPKDVRALQAIARDLGLQAPIIENVLGSNESHKRFLLETCVDSMRPGDTVLMIGASFKQDSDDLRESPNIDLAIGLLDKGFQVDIYDPTVIPSKLLGENLKIAQSKLPSLFGLLVSKEQAESKSYDLVIDTRGGGGGIAAHGRRLADLTNLTFTPVVDTSGDDRA